MPANRFYLVADLSPGSSTLLEGAEHHHLTRVMRTLVNEEVELVNGRGDLAIGKIERVDRRCAEVKILSASRQSDLAPRFFLAIPFMRASKLEWIVEKGTELGAAAFIFYPADFCEKEELRARQLERFHLLAIAALKQSGRLYLPAIRVETGLQSLFVQDSLFLFGHPRGKPFFEPLDATSITFITGPEKGFSQNELELLARQALGVRLSPHILRAETAPIAAASLLGVYQS